MFKTIVREGVAVVMCLCLVSSQTTGGWDIGILRAASKVMEDNQKQEPGPQKENTPPTISKIMDRTIAPHGVATATFLVNDAETPAGGLKVSVTNDQRDIIPDDRLKISGSGAQRTLTVRPLPDKEGTANVTVVVVDKDGLRSTTRFGLTVTTDLPYVPGEVIVRYKEEEDEEGKGRASSASMGVKNLSAGVASAVGVQSVHSLLQHVPRKVSASALTLNRKASRVPPAGAELATQSLTRLERTYVVTFDVKRDVQDVMETLRRDPKVEHVEWNQVFKIDVENDPEYVNKDLWGLKKINAEQAWDDSPKGEGVVVAVLDTGVDVNHEDLAANIWVNPGEIAGNGIDDDSNGYVDDVNGWDFNADDNDPSDVYGHGTHVAGTIAAVGENEIGVIGVAPKAKIMVLKGIGEDGEGSTVHLINGLNYAANNGADVINNSWGEEVSCQEPGVKTLMDAINYAHGRGVVVVAGAGNGDRNQNPIDVNGFSPAGCPNVIAVSATDFWDRTARFSNYGNKIDVAAPGVDILSTIPRGYAFFSGTSMACPHVVGVVALILSKHLTFDSEQVTRQISLSATDLGDVGFDPLFGYGLINAQRSLNTVLVTDNQPPTKPGSPQMVAISNKRLELRWNASSDDERVQGYVVDLSTQINFSPYESRDAGNSNSFQLTSLLPGTPYYARVYAYDLAGNKSVFSDVVSASTLTSVSLPKILNFILYGGGYQGTLEARIDIPIDINESPVFLVYEFAFSADKNFDQLVPEDKIETMANDRSMAIIARDLNSTQKYYFRVRGQDADGNFSDYTYDYAAPSGDRDSPTSPANITWTPVSDSSVRLTWSASTDNVGVDSYLVNFSSARYQTSRSNTNIGNVTEHVFEDLSGGTTYYAEIGARDLANNRSSSYTDFFFPGVPSPKNLRLSTLTSKKLNLSWSGSTQAAGVAGYLVDLSTKEDFSSFVGNYQSLNVGKVTNFDVVGLTQGTQYFARVFAIDAAGKRSRPSPVETATTSPAGTPPAAPERVTLKSLGKGRLSFAWEAVSGSNVAGYLVDLSTASNFSSYVGPNQDRPVPSGKQDMTFEGLDPSKIHYARVRAYNTNDDFSEYSRISYANPSNDTQPSSSYVRSLYLTFLLREPESSEIGYWGGKIDRGEISQKEALLSFYNSPEATVVWLYKRILRRKGDPAGITHWTNLIVDGKMSKEQVLASFLNCAEIGFPASTLTTEAFVEYLYNRFLLRQSDAGGKEFWKRGIETGQFSREQVIQGFFNSTEHNVKRMYSLIKHKDINVNFSEIWQLMKKIDSGEVSQDVVLISLMGDHAGDPIIGELPIKDYVRNIYKSFLFREPERAGWDYYTEKITQGHMSRENALGAISGSPEHFVKWHFYNGDGDLGQMGWWINEIISGRKNFDDVILTAYGRKLNSWSLDDFVRIGLYNQILKRNGNPDEVSYWKHRILSGEITRDQAVLTFGHSTENFVIKLLKCVERPYLDNEQTIRGVWRTAIDSGVLTKEEATVFFFNDR